MTFRSGSLWRTAYELDLTAQPGQNIRTGGSGTKTIDGKTWTWDNDGNVASADIVNGTGLVIVANATATGYYEGANIRTAATLTLPVSSAIPQFDICQNAVRVLVRALLIGADADVEGVQVFFEYATSPRDQNMSVLKVFSGASLGFQSTSNIDPAAGPPAVAYETVYAFNSNGSAHDILGVTFKPPGEVQFWSGLYVAGEKMRLSAQRGSIHQNAGIPAIRTTAAPRFGFCQVTNNVAGALTTTFTHVRVDYCDLLPAI